jgi:hypothetical protein
MARNRRKLEYEDPVTAVELESQLGGDAGRRLRRRIEQSGRLSIEIRSMMLVEQATGFLAEALQLSIDEARDVLIQDAAARGLTLVEAAHRILGRKT